MSQYTPFLNITNLITKQQFRVISYHTTSHPMLLLPNEIELTLIEKTFPHHLLLPKKASDKRNHQISLNKLENLAKRGLEL
jgi:hypothetical protein